MAKTVDMIGFKNGRLTVIKYVGSYDGHAQWLCQCECGNQKIYPGGVLRHRAVKSCGCLYKEKRSEIARNSIAKVKHGDSFKRLYFMWTSMKNRCHVKSNPSYPNYGGRGIKVCDEWANDYSVFKKWAIENGYDENAKRGECTLDRIDVDGNYEPDNCRWVNMKEQCRTKRTTIVIRYDGQSHTIDEWAKILNVPRARIYERYKAGWNPERILLEKSHRVCLPST